VPNPNRSVPNPNRSVPNPNRSVPNIEQHAELANGKLRGDARGKNP